MEYRYDGPITIVCANAYWGWYPQRTGGKPIREDTRYRYVLEFRSMFSPRKPVRLTPDWAIRAEQYALGFWQANYPVPALWNCQWCNEPLIGEGYPKHCTFNGTGEWCPECCWW